MAVVPRPLRGGSKKRRRLRWAEFMRELTGVGGHDVQALSARQLRPASLGGLLGLVKIDFVEAQPWAASVDDQKQADQLVLQSESC